MGCKSLAILFADDRRRNTAFPVMGSGVLRSVCGGEMCVGFLTFVQAVELIQNILQDSISGTFSGVVSSLLTVFLLSLFKKI